MSDVMVGILVVFYIIAVGIAWGGNEGTDE